MAAWIWHRTSDVASQQAAIIQIGMETPFLAQILVGGYGSGDYSVRLRGTGYGYVIANLAWPLNFIDGNLYFISGNVWTDGTNRNATIYVDGEHKFTATPDADSAHGTYAAEVVVPASATLWSGLESNILDIKVWNRMISDAEWKELYANPFAGIYIPTSTFYSFPSAAISGETTWGHDTGVLEANVLDFAGYWTGTGQIYNSGDNEGIALNSGEYMESNIVNTGTDWVTLLQNEYDETGDDVTLEYRTAATEGGISAASYTSYTVPFQSLGYVQIKITSTL
jgi:hypothetical protein